MPKTSLITFNYYNRFKLKHFLQTIQYVQIYEKNMFHEITINDFKGHNMSINNFFFHWDNFLQMGPHTILVAAGCEIVGKNFIFYINEKVLIESILTIWDIDSDYRHPVNLQGLSVLNLLRGCNINWSAKSGTELLGYNVGLHKYVLDIIKKLRTGDILDLQNFYDNRDLKEKKIYFPFFEKNWFKVRSLCQGVVKINLSNNNLGNLPLWLLKLNKSTLSELNLNFNKLNLISLSVLKDIKITITKVWLDGNTLCEDFDEIKYIKCMLGIFPHLVELDDVVIRKGLNVLPLRRNYLIDMSAKNLIEKFILCYFTHYDSVDRSRLSEFYHEEALFSLTRTKVKDKLLSRQVAQLQHFVNKTRKILRWADVIHARKNLIKGRKQIVDTLCSFPQTVHDPTTFTIDVPFCNENMVTITIDGIFKQIIEDPQETQWQKEHPVCLGFRRTFVLRKFQSHQFYVTNELCHIRLAKQSEHLKAFQNPIRNYDNLELIDPDPEETDLLMSAFCTLTNLRWPVASKRLKSNMWDMKKTLKELVEDLKKGNILEIDFQGPTEIVNEYTAMDSCDSDDLSDISNDSGI